MHIILPLSDYPRATERNQEESLAKKVEPKVAGSSLEGDAVFLSSSALKLIFHVPILTCWIVINFNVLVRALQKSRLCANISTKEYLAMFHASLTSFHM